MQSKYRRKILRYAKLSRYRSIWRRIVRVMACAVVFCTTYALILPAITMEQTHYCGLEAHEHTAECYTRQETLSFTCTPGEGELHLHEDMCFDALGDTICPYIEKTEHTHTESCLDETETVICTEAALIYHEHSEACTASQWEELLICTREEHVHAATCDSNSEADLETEADWERSVQQVERTGHWPADLIAVAESQIGYRESIHNYLMEAEGVRKGYTRYGAWYGVPYGSWNAMFAAFCLHYAGIPEEAIPYQSNSQIWIEELQANGWIDTVPDADIAPGDLAFFGDENGDVAFVSIITEAQWGVTENDEPLLYLQIVTGDTEDEVVESYVTTMDSTLLGVVSMERVRQQYDMLYPEMAAEETRPQETLPSEQTEETEPPVSSVQTEEYPTEEAVSDGRVTRVAETENYIVTVSYSEGLLLPEGTELRVVEYSRDSEIFYQRCIQAGYELEWLLNIGFFLEDTELTLDGGFEVVVTSKQGGALGCDITHFASDGFSDFGGGVAPAAEADMPATVADSASITLNFTSWSEWNTISFPNGNDYTCDVGSPITIVLSDSGANYSEAQITVTGGELVSKTYTCGTAGCTHSSWCDTSPTHTIVVRATSANVIVNGSVTGANWTNNSVTLGGDATDATEPTETTEETTAPTEPAGPAVPGYPNHPEAVGTGDVNISRLRFYNICENGDSGVSFLAGCVFEIVGDNGYRATVVSENTPEVDLPADIPDGNYTITELSAPDGYMRDTDYQRTFTVSEGKLVSDRTIGTFINHDLRQLTSDKTAEVEDYNNRIYQVLLSAESHMRMYRMDPVDVLFVVDQSNSMLFPSGLDPTGKSVTLRLDGSGNVSSMEALNLDKNQVYYIISDPAGTATVWALWYNGQSWMYQDASYYAKAWYNNDLGYQDPNEQAIFPQNRSYSEQAAAEAEDERSNGGGLGYRLSGSGLGTYIDTFSGDAGTFEIYTASSEYNRLHYLEEALTNMIYELADINDQNRVTLTEFTKEVDEENDCMGPLVLSPDNVEALVYEVRHINTSGGTRQDLALKHVYNEHLNDTTESFSGDPDNTYTILITDGAPVRSSGSELSNLGSPDDPASTTADSIYAQIKGYAALVRERSTLMTVGLGMDKVEGGKKVLQEIATSDNFNCALEDAAELVKQMQELLFSAFRPKEQIRMKGDVIDEISDSFYPIAFTDPGSGAATGRKVLVQDAAQDWILLQSGDWITLEGKYTTAGASDAAGQLLQREDGTFYIRWADILLSNPYDGVDPVGIAWVTAGTGSGTGRTVLGTYDGKDWIRLNNGDYITQQGEYYPTNGTLGGYQAWYYGRYTDGSINWGRGADGNRRILFDPGQVGYGWHGTFYVKAKEDFIGGNAINTNKSASVTMTADQDDMVTAQKHFETPTVNVRLLDMNEMHSEVTIYLGDTVNEAGNIPLDSVQFFFDNTVITKLISDGGDVLNRVTAESADGLEDAAFYIRYALGRDLTDAQWQTLASGEVMTIPYVYDNPSSRGPVGEFTFHLEKTGMEGANVSFDAHEATAACQPGGQPLTENCDSPAETYTLHITYEAYGLGENGRPAGNVHNGTGSPGTEVGTGTTLETGLGKVEKENIHEVHVISGAIEITKKFAEGVTAEEDRTFTFVLHRTEDGEDTTRDISKTITIPAGASAGEASITFGSLRRGTYTVTEAPDDTYVAQSIQVLNTTNCYSEPAIGGSAQTVTFVMGNNVSNGNVIGRTGQEDAYTSYLDPVNGVFGAAEFTNREIVYTGEIPVTKVWDDGPDSHIAGAVYVVLYLDDAPVQADGSHRMLRLDAQSNWQGAFEVVLTDKDDRVTNYHYSVREVSQISDDSRYQDTWHSAVLENDGSIVYYEKALEAGSILGADGRGYMVQYTPGENGAWTVTNHRAVELPSTGGMGTQRYTFSGLLVIMAALVYGYSRRRKREGGPDGE